MTLWLNSHGGLPKLQSKDSGQRATPMKALLLFGLLSFPVSTWAQKGLGDAWIVFSRAGAPNSNLQCFAPNNVSVSDGNLVIITRPEASTCRSFDLPTATYNYTSGFVSMRRFNFLYGIVEFRAKFGGGADTGSWPIVWMEDASCQASDPTGTDDNCNGQEIDIAEILRSDFTAVNQEMHVDNYAHNDGCTAHTSDTSRNFHTYDLVWAPGTLVFKIDGTSTCTLKKRYVPNAPMYLKVDNFVGCVGGPVDNRSLPWTTLMDYVKVTQGNRVVFFDDFDGRAPVESQPAVRAALFSGHRAGRTSGAKPVTRSEILASLITILVIVLSVSTVRLARSRTKGH